MFYNGCTKLHEENAKWADFKSTFRRSFTDIHPDKYHFMKLQAARQGRNESPQESADRRRGVAQKIMGKQTIQLLDAYTAKIRSVCF